MIVHTQYLGNQELLKLQKNGIPRIGQYRFRGGVASV